MSTLELNNFEQISELLKRQSDRLSNQELNKYTDRLGAKYVKLVQLSFRNSKDPFGKRWKPLKTRVGQILKDSGRLSNSIAHESTINSVRIFVQGGLIYAETHNSGDKERGIPQRMFIPNEGKLPEQYLKIATDMLIKQLRTGRL